MANYTKTTIGKENRIELHEKLSLTGAEISLNELPAGANVPFVHSHKENEDVYKRQLVCSVPGGMAWKKALSLMMHWTIKNTKGKMCIRYRL